MPTTDTAKIIAEDVASLLCERVLDTGTAYLRGVDLYYRAEENSDERFLGAVEADDVENVRDAIREFFAN